MKIEDFEKELQTIDKDLSIRPNNPSQRVLDKFPDAAKIASVLYQGSELCSIPNYDIYDEPSGNYGVDLRNDGRFVRHRSRPEALEIIREKLDRIKNDKDYRNAFFGIEEYSDSALKAKDPVVVEVVSEIPIEIKEVTGGMIEGAK